MSTNEETITSHAYDVDLIATYHGLLEMEFTKSHGLTKELYLKKISDLGKFFCKKNCLYYPFYFNQRIPLVVQSSFYNFELYLGLFLISFESPKIPALLTYQKSNYKGNFDFINLVDFLVYKIVRNNSPNDNYVRLEKIMEWVSAERSMVNQNEELITNSKVGNDDVLTKKHSTIVYALFHYYLQEAKYEILFDCYLKLKKKAAIISTGKSYGVSGYNFLNHYYNIANRKNRVAFKNVKHLESVVKMLTNYPGAEKIAEKELTEAKSLQ
jgi:hypothetical protein